MLFHANHQHLCERARSRHSKSQTDLPALCPRDIAQFQARIADKNFIHHAYYSRPYDLESCCWLLWWGVHVFVNKMRRGQIDAEWVQPWVQFGKSRAHQHTPRAYSYSSNVNASIWDQLLPSTRSRCLFCHQVALGHLRGLLIVQCVCTEFNWELLMVCEALKLRCVRRYQVISTEQTLSRGKSYSILRSIIFTLRQFFIFLMFTKVFLPP